ncbi:MAG TPA: TadE family protein [Luteimonas sp.]|nr:TadE family protein [Luteimonas sp.]
MDQQRSAGLRRRRMAGQSMIELIIVAPLVFFFILVTIQFVILYRIKATLDYATFEAARAGAVNGADKDAMRQGLAKGLVPLYTTGKSITDLELAYGKAWIAVRNPLVTSIEVISPTRAAFNDHRERQWNGRYAIPNDNLAFRARTIKGSGVNVQDANILKIKVTYNVPLVVPFVGLVLRGNSAFLKAGMFEPSPVNRFTGRLPIESSAIVRMQSPIYDQTVLAP